jgi:hypothetical protein
VKKLLARTETKVLLGMGLVVLLGVNLSLGMAVLVVGLIFFWGMSQGWSRGRHEANELQRAAYEESLKRRYSRSDGGE